MSEWKCVNSGGPLVNVDAFGRVRSTGVVVCRWVSAWHVNVGGRGLFPDPVKSYLDWSGDLTRFGFKLERTIAMMWEAMMEPLPDELPDLPDELLSEADEEVADSSSCCRRSCIEKDHIKRCQQEWDVDSHPPHENRGEIFRQRTTKLLLLRKCGLPHCIPTAMEDLPYRCHTVP